jgi:hypothetical protein
MSDAKKKLDRFIIARMRKLAARMVEPGLSLMEQSELSREMDLLGRRLIAQAEPTKDETEVVAFIERLETRQGTIPPDFQTLYARKADLDRRFFSRNQP